MSSTDFNKVNSLPYDTTKFNLSSVAPCLRPYLKSSYKADLLISEAVTLSDNLINYFNPVTLIFLSTSAPKSPMSELEDDTMNKFYLLKGWLPKTLNNFTFTDEFVMHVRSSLPNVPVANLFQFSSSWDNHALEIIEWAKPLLNKLQGRADSGIDLKVFDILWPFQEELTWFEIHSSVRAGRHVMDFKETPSVKLYYPEPFVATPSFVHEDVWFLHILLYAHWLWFFFISLIILFFITFINTVRWCNYRVRPKRETRGVSRSKCADLITACVPVSWAISIIISESTDAVDYYDGFGTGELILGIRAYQWGWQYYYPKGMDLSYNVTPTYNSLVGKSLHTSRGNSQNTTSNKLWRHYQSAELNSSSSTPTSVLLSPSMNSKILKFIDTNSVGTNTLKATDSFKRIQQFSKVNNSSLFVNNSDLSNQYSKLKSLYSTTSNLNKSLVYGTTTQHNLTSSMSTQVDNNTWLERRALSSYWEYNTLFTTDKESYLTPISLTNLDISTATTDANTNYFPTPAVYVDYDLTNYKHARQVENLFWESRLKLKHTQLPDTKPLLPVYEDYYQNTHDWANSDSMLISDNLRSGILDTDTLSKSLNSENNFFLNPSLIPTDYLNLFFFRSFTDDWDSAYLNRKLWASLTRSGQLQEMNSLYNTTLPVSLSHVMDQYPTVENPKLHFSDNFFYLKSSTLLVDELSLKGLHLKASNPFHIRASAKESITTYNALRKVFKARFDENRSNVRLTNISGLGLPAPYINMPKVTLENLLNKNSSSFFTKATYKDSLLQTYSTYWSLDSLLNFYLSDLPFLKSLKSDASRYIWFDWGSRWERIEVQPSSIARYSLLGVPYSKNKFMYSSKNSPKLNKLNNSLMLESENYFSRLGRSRKNYITTSAYSPYLYSRLITSNTLSKFSNKVITESTKDIKLFIKSLQTNWLSEAYTSSTSYPTNSTSVSFNTPGRSFTEPLTGLGTYSYFITKSSSILTKREDFYRRYLLEKGYSTSNYSGVVSSLSNPTLNLIKSNFQIIDPSRISPEFNRPDFRQDNNLLSTLRSYKFVSPLTYYLESMPLTLENFTPNNLQKNQYRPMRKGITNMVRLHATGAVAIPTEIRIHILASSKDVIHSWAIPSAGIKIDCIPGYSSHRTTIFFNSGIYWGQCMEICGRFHHWMPIVLYIMKRDLFFVWVTHFIHYNKNTSSFTGISNTNTSSNGLVSRTKPFYSYTLPSPFPPTQL